MQRYILFVFFLLIALAGHARQAPDTTGAGSKDSLSLKDSSRVIDLATVNAQTLTSYLGGGGDTTAKLSRDLLSAPPQQLIWELMKRNTYFNFSLPKPVSGDNGTLRQWQGKDLLFYSLVLLFLLFAFLRQAFPKYFYDLFRLFFRTTIKQRQTKEQLMQTPLPSLLLNGFFVLSAAFYTSFLAQYYQLAPGVNFWMLFLYASAALAVIYTIKFTGLKIAGWVFNMKETADAYIFIVFIINKMMGILLLPFLLVLAFSVTKIHDGGLFLSLFVVGGLLLYRFILSFAVIRSQARVNPFHFFLYLCAFEIAPLLLLYKGILLFFGITA